MAERRTRDRNMNRRVLPEDVDGEEKDDRAPQSPMSVDSSSSGGRFTHARRERQARRRVQPLGEEESEEARVRGVPVPPVGLLPEMETENESAAGSSGVSLGSDGGDGGGEVAGDQQGSSITASKAAYVAAQLRQLALAVGSLTRPPLAERGEQGGSGKVAGKGAQEGSLTPDFVLPSPSVGLQLQPRSTGSATAPSPGAAPSPNEERTLKGAPSLDQPTPTASWAPLSGGAKMLGPPSSVSPIGSATVGGSAAGATPRGPDVSAISEAGSGVETEALWSQQSSVKGFLISQLERLSQMLDSPTGTTRVAMGDSAAASATTFASGDALEAQAEQGAAVRRGGGREHRTSKSTVSEASSLQYSLSGVSSSSSSSAPFSPSAAVASAAWAAAYGRSKEDGDRGAPAGDKKVEADGTNDNDNDGDGENEVFVACPAAFCSTSREPAAAAPFEGGGLVTVGERRVPLPVVPAPPMTPISGSNIGSRRSSRSSRSSRTTGPPSLAGLRPGTIVPSTAAIREDDVEDAKMEDKEDETRDGRQSSSSAAPALSSSSMWRSARSVREGSAESRRRSSVGSRFTEAFGRAKLWRRMLEVESRRESAVMANIVAENSGTLDQGIVLPCAPSDEEKLIYHKTGRCFLVSAGVLSVASLSAGMWLFTFAAPFFYWFGAPTAFIMGYLLLSYFGVAVWGKNFDPDDHTARIAQAKRDRYYPSVDVFLPVCREPTHVLDNTWKHVRALDYPNLTVHVLDDGAKEEVRQLADMHGFNYIRRTNIPELKKAGNLRYAFARTTGEVIAIFDADFCPRPEFLRETTPYFKDREVAILQTPQFFRYREEQTWVEKGAGVTQELFYRMVQVNRNKFDAAICVGTCGVYRRESLAPFGGTAAIGYSEDVHTGFNCIQLGYKVKYVPVVMAMGTCPDEPRAFFMQQYRWCMGSTTLLLNREFWRSRLTKMQKLCYLSGMLYYSATAVTIFTGPMPGMLLIWFKPEAVFWFNISFAVPSILFSFVGMRFWAKQRYGFSCQRVKVIQSYSHLYALKDKLMNTTVPWVPTGGGASSRSSSKAYDSSLKLMLVWTMAYTLLTVGGAAWRITEFPWYHFLPTILLSILNFGLHISTLLA